jgi:predicted kinase
MQLILIVLMALSACSQSKYADNNSLPNYEMMQAAEDAGNTPSK